MQNLTLSQNFHDSAFIIPGRYQKGTVSYHRDTSIFIAVLFPTARKWTQPRCPTTDKWVLKKCNTNIVGILFSYKEK